MSPEQNGVRPVTLHGDLVSVTEQRVNGRIQGVTYGSGRDNLQMCRCNSASPRPSIDRARAGRAGVTRLLTTSIKIQPGQARPGGWVGVRFPMTWGDVLMRCARRGG